MLCNYLLVFIMSNDESLIMMRIDMDILIKDIINKR